MKKLILGLVLACSVACKTRVDLECPGEGKKDVSALGNECPGGASSDLKKIMNRSCVNKGISKFHSSAWAEKGVAWDHTDLMVYFYRDGGMLASKNSNRLMIDEWLHYAKVWEKYTNLRFYVTENVEKADLRVSFNCDGHWSYIGQQAEYIPKNMATMNCHWTNYDPPGDRQRVALHEIGHALGLGHEHMSPVVKINWNKPLVYDYYWRTQNWDKDMVDRQVLNPEGLNGYDTTGYDRDSIMHYPIDPVLTTDGNGVGWNFNLTAKDVEMVNKLYPKWKSKNGWSKEDLTDYKSRLR